MSAPLADGPPVAVLYVSIDLRLYERDGRFFSHDGGSYDYEFWSRYLSAFDEVRIVCRVAPLQELGEVQHLVEVTGPSVAVEPIADFTSIRSMLRQRSAIRSALRRMVERPHSHHLLRVPSPLGNLFASELRRASVLYAAEVVGDPWTVFAPGAIDHPLRPILRIAQRVQLWWVVRGSTAVAYVTRRTLQKRYPPPKGSITRSYSSIVSTGVVASEIRRVGQVRRLVTVGSMAQPYKGIDLLIDALSELSDVHLTVVGEGPIRPELERRAETAGVGQRVTFTGQLERGREVEAQLADADVFILASRTEGLPRAMIEAMSTGMTCVGANVGGIPELIPTSGLFEPNDVAAICAMVRRLQADVDFREQLARTELATAATYTPETMNAERSEFFAAVRALR